ncbi:MAG TPA: carotenoid oxygenase family protein [Rhizomicrobium sp.]|nr:carotenoid oxygenase family protein [Rhizomicrobium sp.]
MNAPLPINPFLSGNFAPIRSEDDFADLSVEGEIPQELHGTLYRNGPNPQFQPRDSAHHWFAGDGMIHAFRFLDGKISYRNRYVRTPKWEAEHAAGRSLFGTFGNPLTSDPAAAGTDAGLANTNIIFHAGRLLALEEAHQPFELEAGSLAPRGYVPYAGAAHRFTAHPKTDPETGELVFFGYMAGEGFFSDQVAYGVVDPDGTVTRLNPFTAPYASMIHDFFVTRNYVAFPVLPLTGSLARAMQGGPPLAWEPEKGSHIGVMRRDAGVETMCWFTTDPCYMFHPMNMWEEDGVLHAHVMQYDRAPLFPDADGRRRETAPARLAHWTMLLDGDSSIVRRELIDDLAGEFPRFDERCSGLAYRHGWFAAHTRNEGERTFDSLAHIDFARGGRSVYTFPPGDAPGEPVFVPRGPEEGDGWILSVVYRGAGNRSEVAIFEARDIARGPIGIAKLPRRMPFGFHGNWVASC